MEQGSQGEVVGRYAFRHALYAEVIYQRLFPSEIVRLHLLIGESLEKLYGENDLNYAAELALHFEKGWDWTRAIRYLMPAAANASHRFANRQTNDYLLRALSMVERLPKERQMETHTNLLKQSTAIKQRSSDTAGIKANLENMPTNA